MPIHCGSWAWTCQNLSSCLKSSFIPQTLGNHPNVFSRPKLLPTSLFSEIADCHVLRVTWAAKAVQVTPSISYLVLSANFSKWASVMTEGQVSESLTTDNKEMKFFSQLTAMISKISWPTFTSVAISVVNTCSPIVTDNILHWTLVSICISITIRMSSLVTPHVWHKQRH